MVPILDIQTKAVAANMVTDTHTHAHTHTRAHTYTHTYTHTHTQTHTQSNCCSPHACMPRVNKSYLSSITQGHKCLEMAECHDV